ncbi:MAG: BTAD domain-containing putative transcriptional regulator [Desulfobacteraceae bacterium]|jgi:DNA-binding SARP family transcriptional activator
MTALEKQVKTATRPLERCAMKQSKGLITKISPPRLHSVYNRKRLFNLIDKYREYPATWVSGGPGSGKTTLAASYIKSRNVPCIWYQMDRVDDDPANFFHYLTLAASKAGNGVTGPLPRLSPENLLNTQNFALQYFRELFEHLNKPFIIVLDNYQEIPTDSEINNLINAGLEQVPFDLNVIILSRTPPPAVMARLLVNKAMMTIQHEELFLTEKESVGIAALADKWKPYLESVAKIFNFTDGWTAGLVLMLEYCDPEAQTPFGSTEMAKELFFNYFAGEIFNKMEPAVQDFLAKLACMPSFTLEAAVKITGFTKAGKILDDMNRKNYFTEKKIDNGASYQFHPLFRAFLLSKTEESLAPQLLIELFQNTADTLVELGQLEDAFHLYTKSKNPTAQVDLIRDHAASLMAQGRVGIVEHWLKALPRDIFDSDPRLLYIYGQCRMPVDPIESRNAFIQAYHLLDNKFDRPTLIHTICGVVETILTEWGDYRQLDPWIEELGSLLKDEKNLLSEDIEARALFALFSGLMFRQPQHPDMKMLEKRMFELLRSETETQLRLLAGTYLSHYFCWTGDILQARIVIAIMRELMTHATLPPLAFMTIKTQEAVYEWFEANFKGCLKAVNEGLKEAEKSGIHITDNWLLAQEVYARLTLDDPELAQPTLDKMKPILNSRRYLDIGHYHHLQSLFCRITGDIDNALQHGKEALRLAIETGTLFPEGLNCITVAQMCFEKGDEETANELNARAVTIAHSMQSRYLEMLSLFNQVYFNLKSEKQDQAEKPLTAALKIQKDLDLKNFSTWRQAFMQDLYEEALRSGIEVQYVRRLIRKRNLHPTPSCVDIENWPWRLKIYTLGRFSLCIDEKPMIFPGKPQAKPLEMLKSLIALGGKGVGLSRIEDLLWPDAEGDKAYQALITTLHRLRKLIGDKKVVMLSESRMSLNIRYCWLDVWDIENLCGKAKQITAKLSHDNNAVSCAADKLLRLYRGDFLKNENDLAWAIPPRKRLRDMFVRTLNLFAKEYIQQRNDEGAIDLYIRGLEADEIAEELYQGLMMCYQRLGRKADGLSTYERCRETLLSVLGSTPSPKTESIRRALRQ